MGGGGAFLPPVGPGYDRKLPIIPLLGGTSTMWVCLLALPSSALGPLRGPCPSSTRLAAVEMLQGNHCREVNKRTQKEEKIILQKIAEEDLLIREVARKPSYEIADIELRLGKALATERGGRVCSKVFERVFFNELLAGVQ